MPADLDQRELERYVQRVADRWTLEGAYLGGARVQDLRGAPPQRERGSEFVAVFVSQFFDGVPWLERVYQAGALWDADVMGGPIDVHCYTPAELERKRGVVGAVGDAVSNGLDLLGGPVSP